MNDVLFAVLKIVVIVVTLIITRFIIPYLSSVISRSEYKEIADLVLDAVQYAEQTINGSGMGEKKKEEVISYVVKQLADKGIKIDEAELNVLIESAVYVMNKEKG